jgi:hypothetical protein
MEQFKSSKFKLFGFTQTKLFKQIDGAYSSISEKVEVDVTPLKKGHLQGASYDKVVDFWNKVQNMYADVTALSLNLNDAQKRVDMMLAAYERANKTNDGLHTQLLATRSQLKALDYSLNGSKARGEVGEKNEYPTVRNYLGVASSGTSSSTYGPTPTHEKCFSNAEKMFKDINASVNQIRKSELPKLEEQLRAIGAPLLEGQSR